jgi:predicted adenylyl cyclase CyaB
MEIEIKLRIEDRAALRARLRAAGARSVRRVHEMNTLFDTPRRALRKRGVLLRLRDLTVLDGPRDTSAVLTLKGPSQANRKYKVREELNLPLPGAATVREALGMLGFRPVVRYEKFRTSLHWPREPRLHVEWDETPIGAFLELEGSPQAIDRLARRLGFHSRDYIRASYLALNAAYRKARGRAIGEMLFYRGRNRARQRIFS